MRERKKSKWENEIRKGKENVGEKEWRCSGQTWRNPRERTSDFSLGSWEIRPSDSFATRRRVVLLGEDNA